MKWETFWGWQLGNSSLETRSKPKHSEPSQSWEPVNSLRCLNLFEMNFFYLYPPKFHINTYYILFIVCSLLKLYSFFPLHSGRTFQVCIILGFNILFMGSYLFVCFTDANTWLNCGIYFYFSSRLLISYTSPYFFLSLLNPSLNLVSLIWSTSSRMLLENKANAM